MCGWVGGARLSSPRAPASPAPAARQLCAPVRPEVTGKQLDRQLAPGKPLLSPGAPRKGKGERSGCLILVSSNSHCQALAGNREPGAGGSSSFLPRPRSPPWVHGPPGPGEEARRGGRPGHCAAGARSRGLAGPAPLHGDLGRAPLAGPARAQPGKAGRSLRGRGAPGSRLAPRPSSRGPLWQLAGRVPLFATLRRAPLQPSPAPTHPRTHPHPGAGRVAHLSPKSC